MYFIYSNDLNILMNVDNNFKNINFDNFDIYNIPENEMINEIAISEKFLNKIEKYKITHIHRFTNQEIRNFNKILNNYIHIFNNISEFKDYYHYDFEKYEDYEIVNDIKIYVYFDFNIKNFVNNLNNLDIKSNMNNYINSKFLRKLIKLYFKNNILRNNLLIIIYELLIYICNNQKY